MNERNIRTCPTLTQKIGALTPHIATTGEGTWERWKKRGYTGINIFKAHGAFRGKWVYMRATYIYIYHRSASRVPPSMSHSIGRPEC